MQFTSEAVEKATQPPARSPQDARNDAARDEARDFKWPGDGPNDQEGEDHGEDSQRGVDAENIHKRQRTGFPFLTTHPEQFHVVLRELRLCVAAHL